MAGFDKTGKALLMQQGLQARGLYKGQLDNIWGEQSEHAYQEFRKSLLFGKGTWGFFAEIDGKDIVVKNANATAFGGDSDKGDNGETASGFPTKGHPELLACSLPMDGFGVKSLTGSPLPKMPFGLTRDGLTNPDGVHVIATSLDGSTQTPPLPVIDIGPSRSSGNALDLSVAAAQLFHHQATSNNFKMRLNYRIVTGAKYIK